MAATANTQDLKINATQILDFFLKFITVASDFRCSNIASQEINVFHWKIDFVKEF